MVVLFWWIAVVCLALIASIFLVAVLRAPRWPAKDERGQRCLDYDDV